jgi:SAM-dependent methyltransferase
MKDFWNARYSEATYAYGKTPNNFFAGELVARLPGRLLLPCEGEGRNAVYAAALGWEVRAFDLAEAGRDKALALAREAGARIEYEVAPHAEAHVEPGWADVAALIYAHVPADGRRDFHRRVARGLRPGGVLLLEGFEVGQLGRDSGGPKNEAMLFDEARLREDFAPELAIDRLETTEVVLEEGRFHRGPARVIRLVGRRASD